MAPEHEGDERSWQQYRQLVLRELERIDKGMSELNKKMEQAMDVRDEMISKMRVEIAMLKVQAGMWGALAGASGSAIVSGLVAVLFARGH